MTYLQAIILGLAQGLSEFLPISSSGHLALLQYFFGVDAAGAAVCGSSASGHADIGIHRILERYYGTGEGTGSRDQRYFHGKGTSGQCQSNQTAWIHDHRGYHTDGDHRPGVQ